MAIITGTNAGETLPGTAGKDTITGAGGDDKALMGAGNDVLIWAPGDGNDTVEGGTGTDVLHFDGTGGGESFIISANGARARLTRDVGNVTMDLNDVERIELQAFGGSDTIIVDDVSGTDLKQVAIDLGAGDASIDTVYCYGNNANNTVNVATVGGGVSVSGLAAQVTIANSEFTDDLVLQGFAGNDKINASALTAGLIHFNAVGGKGNDTITGSAGEDLLYGGDDNDTVAGGHGDDLVLLGNGNDLFVWNLGDGSDTVEGEAGTDTLRFIGSNTPADLIAMGANGTRSALTFNIGNVSMDLNGIERFEVRALGGEDRITVDDFATSGVTNVIVDLAAVSGGAAGDKKIDSVIVNGKPGDDTVKIASVGSAIVTTGMAAEVSVVHADKTDILTINGGVGGDTIDASKLAAGKVALELEGGSGNDSLTGSAGNDVITGGFGNDLASLGAGNDVFVWDTGNADDTIDGQAGTDTLQFNASDSSESFEVFANGDHARVARNVDDILMDLKNVERIELRALGGVDEVNVNDLAGTDVKTVAVVLSTFGGGGDLQSDAVNVEATSGNDKINVGVAGGSVSVTGLAAQVTIAGAESDKDGLAIIGLGGNDTINASKLSVGVMHLVVDGGSGNDVIVGSLDADTLLGGIDNDTVAGEDGADLAILGAGNDLFLWNLGDGSDTIEGQADIDTVRITGSNANDAVLILANGGRALVNTTDGGVLDTNDVERIELRMLGGVDGIHVGDLTGTDVTEVAIDLAATAGGKTADTKIDTVIVDSAFDGSTVVTSVGSKVVATNAQGQVTIDHAGKTDLLIFNGSGGDDVVNASTVAAGKMELQFFGGLGGDVIFGSAGNDTVNGGDGADAAFLGAGNDLFVWNHGDDNDTIEGQSGTDTLRFNGFGVSENIQIVANGGRALFFRDVASVLMDLNDVERIEFQALGGSDTVIVGDLSGTDVTQVAVDLAGVLGGAAGDGQIDTVTANATAGNDKISLAVVGGVFSVTGLPAQLTVSHADAVDMLTINGFGGDDVINVSKQPAGALRVSVDGGAGNDKITGGLGNNNLVGGDNNDVLTDGNGNDVLAGGNGDDTLTGGNGNDSLLGEAGKDVLNGGAGNDFLIGGGGDDTITGGTGSDAVLYQSVLDGHDLVVGFDGNAAGGQDTFNLDALFDTLLVASANRAGRVSIVDKGATVDVFVDADGLAGFELAVATLKTSDVITVGQDVLVGLST